MESNYVSLSEKTAKKISDMVLVEKKYKPFERIPTELELAQELNVSRTSIREAIKILIANNVLYIKRGVGTFVNHEIEREQLPFDIFYSRNKKKLVKDAFEVRLLLEVEAAELAAKNATEDDIKHIRLMKEKCEDKIKKNSSFEVEDQNFHKSIASASKNTIILQIAPLLQITISTTLHAYTNFKGTDKQLIDNALYYHAEILRQIETRDSKGAGYAMYCHIINTSYTVNRPFEV